MAIQTMHFAYAARLDETQSSALAVVGVHSKGRFIVFMPKGEKVAFTYLLQQELFPSALQRALEDSPGKFWGEIKKSCGLVSKDSWSATSQCKSTSDNWFKLTPKHGRATANVSVTESSAWSVRGLGLFSF